jgi:hypothetical protein
MWHEQTLRRFGGAEQTGTHPRAPPNRQQGHFDKTITGNLSLANPQLFQRIATIRAPKYERFDVVRQDGHRAQHVPLGARSRGALDIGHI